MTEPIVINPVTRIEGHAKITIHLDNDGAVNEARFHVVEFRGFEKFCEGRYFAEMPAITSRVCGICPVSHILAGGKACDAIIGVELPTTAKLLRELMHLGQLVQSHALSFFHLSSPDMLLGFDSDPATRNVMGLIAKHPELARQGIRLRRFGQEVIRHVGGRRIHAESAVPGGMNSSLSEESRNELLSDLPEALQVADGALELLKGYLDANSAESDAFARFDSNYLSLVQPDGGLEHYDGVLRFCGVNGEVLHDQVRCEDYLEHIGEASEEWSYLKFPFMKAQGYPEGMYRVGPLARLNACSHIPTDKANTLHREWKASRESVEPGSFHYHAARLIEIVYSLERIQEILDDPQVTGQETCRPGRPKNHEGVGCIEAPRGTLFHHYWVDDTGRIEKVNLVVATGHNNLAMNAAVTSVAKRYVKPENLEEGMLNRVEAAIRCYDPCLSCSTHAVGTMPITVDLLDAQGHLLDSIARS